MLSGSHESGQTADHRANFNASKQMVYSNYSNAYPGILSGYKTINPLDTLSQRQAGCGSRQQQTNYDPGFIKQEDSIFSQDNVSAYQIMS